MPVSANIHRRIRFDRPGVVVYIIGICLLCWVGGYVVSLGFPIEADPSDTPVWASLSRFLSGKLPSYLIGFLLALGGAFLVQRVSYALVLIRDRSFLPFLFFFLLLSTNACIFPLQSTSFALFCLVFALYLLFTTYHDPTSVGRSFGAAFLLGVGSLLWVHILWFVPLFWIGMHMFRSLSPKSFMASLIGVTVVYWLLLAWAVWTGDYTCFTIPAQSLADFRPFFWHFSDWIEWVPILIVVSLVVTAFVNVMAHELADSLRTREFLSFLMLLIAWSTILFFLYEQASVEFMHMMAVPSSTLIAHFFATRQNRYTFWLMIATIIALPALLILQLSWSF
ncbi:hypothetical protein M2137_002044 [Parabacteroides sp. PFB2-10]|uniref:hypothetical protein n=1 Tax=Parabacteroides sp. PFB2-10 TaxID=1742405 RepID=UPI002474CAEB|nr:hypothetical protein [Parabacteroides sp. PFB2-10]MDH6313254.1 hypothetical protein [Parabacteroides sp. PFB2-10]MDL2245669.1 hypothetical protein [Parabacteroides sp. OttesenSCG-928-J18]